MSNTSILTQPQIQSLIARLDTILAELDAANLGMPAIDVASAITKLQRRCAPQPTPERGALRSTA